MLPSPAASILRALISSAEGERDAVFAEITLDFHVRADAGRQRIVSYVWRPIIIPPRALSAASQASSDRKLGGRSMRENARWAAGLSLIVKSAWARLAVMAGRRSRPPLPARPQAGSPIAPEDAAMPRAKRKQGPKSPEP